MQLSKANILAMIVASAPLAGIIGSEQYEAYEQKLKQLPPETQKTMADTYKITGVVTAKFSSLPVDEQETIATRIFDQQMQPKQQELFFIQMAELANYLPKDVTNVLTYTSSPHTTSFTEQLTNRPAAKIIR